MCNHLFIVTGGPGAGKTTLVEALSRHGVAHMPEAGRAIIQEQQAVGGTALPWADRAAFAERMFQRDLASYTIASVMPGPVMMDRGMIDVIGYLSLCGLDVPDHLDAAARRHPYNRRVFLAPYWATIFKQDNERRQERREAEETTRVMAKTYRAFGYDVITLPRVCVEDRVAFLMVQLKS